MGYFEMFVLVQACETTSPSENPREVEATCIEGERTLCTCADGSQGVSICQYGMPGDCTNCSPVMGPDGSTTNDNIVVAKDASTAVLDSQVVTGGTGSPPPTAGMSPPQAGNTGDEENRPTSCAGLQGIELTICYNQMTGEMPVSCVGLTPEEQEHCCDGVIAVILDTHVVGQHYPECASMIGEVGQSGQQGVCTLEESDSLRGTGESTPVMECYIGEDGMGGMLGCDALHGSMADVAMLESCMPECIVTTIGVSKTCADCFGAAQLAVNTLCYQQECTPLDSICTFSCTSTKISGEFSTCYTR